jgi:DnaJ-domain-containing protein 1
MKNQCRQDEIKRSVRNLKKLELKIRFNQEQIPDGLRTRIVWNEFFNLKEQGKGKYSLDFLASLSKEEFKEVINEFFFKVYEQYYAENALNYINVKNADKLALLGLTYDADNDMVKARFRELAKKYHPDHGGDREQFIWLMEIYKELTGKL